jgi:hypothetical protein
MDCLQFLEQLPDCLDEPDPQRVSEAAREHLAFCRNCKIIYSTTRRTVQIAGEWGADLYTFPDFVCHRVRNRIRSRLTFETFEPSRERRRAGRERAVR